MAKNRHSHYQSDREHEATHDLDEARVVGVELRRATLDDLREETAEREQDTGGELQGGRGQMKGAQDHAATRRLTAFMKTFSGRVLCFEMASSTIATATSEGLRVLTGCMDAIVWG